MAKGNIPDGYRLIKILFKNVSIRVETLQKIKELKEKGEIKSVNSFVQAAVERELKRFKVKA